MTSPLPVSDAAPAALGTALADADGAAGLKPRRRRGGRRAPLGARLLRYRWLYLLLAPGIVYFAIFKYAPMYGVSIAFQDYVPFLGMTGSPWVGFAHFHDLFTSPDFARVLTNNLVLAALKVLIAFPAPIVVALLLNEVRVAIVKRAVQTAIYIPHFLSWTVIASLTYLLFALDTGPLTHLLNGVLQHRFEYLTDPNWFRPLIVLQWLWKETGWGSIVYLAALAGVDPALYEAARMDGASRWQQMRHVTLPAIRSTIVVMLILSCGHLLDTGFEQIFLMTNSLNRNVADVFDTFVYYIGITNGEYSYAAAVGLFKGIVGVLLVFGANWLAKRTSQSGLF